MVVSSKKTQLRVKACLFKIAPPYRDFVHLRRLWWLIWGWCEAVSSCYSFQTRQYLEQLCPPNFHQTHSCRGHFTPKALHSLFYLAQIVPSVSQNVHPPYTTLTLSYLCGARIAFSVRYLMGWGGGGSALLKKKIKFSCYIRKFRVEQLQSHIWGRASYSIWGNKKKCVNISPYMRRPLVIYGFATAPLWISLYMRKIDFFFISVQGDGHKIIKMGMASTKEWSDEYGIFLHSNILISV
jgi:hypothetical protein